MLNLTRTEPTELLRFEPFRDFEDMLRGWRLRPFTAEMPALPEFRMDMKEDDKAYYVKADLPGFRKEEIAITIDGNLVTVTAETKREEEKKNEGETELCIERYTGKLARRFTVRHDLDETAAEATYRDGVLELKLPKKAASAARQLPVQ